MAVKVSGHRHCLQFISQRNMSGLTGPTSFIISSILCFSRSQFYNKAKNLWDQLLSSLTLCCLGEVKGRGQGTSVLLFWAILNVSSLFSLFCWHFIASKTSLCCQPIWVLHWSVLRVLAYTELQGLGEIFHHFGGRSEE